MKHTFILHTPTYQIEVSTDEAEDRAHALHILIQENYVDFMDAERIEYKED